MKKPAHFKNLKELDRYLEKQLKPSKSALEKAYRDSAKPNPYLKLAGHENKMSQITVRISINDGKSHIIKSPRFSETHGHATAIDMVGNLIVYCIKKETGFPVPRYRTTHTVRGVVVELIENSRKQK